MKVLILTEGGEKTGFGHLTRSLALAQGIEKYIGIWMHTKSKQSDNNIDIEFVVHGDKLAKEFLNGKNFKIKIKDWVKEYRNLEGKLKKKDLVIIDSYLATERTYDFIYKKLHTQTSQQTADRRTDSFIHKLICIDDYNRIKYPPCIIINGSIYGGRLKYPLHSTTYKPIYLLGQDYIILRKEFWRVPRKYIRKRVKDVLITFGGTNHSNFIKTIMHFLLKQFPNFNYHLVVSNSHLIRNLRLNFKHYSNLSCLEMRNLMLKCDIAISGGGQILYELARIGTPTIGIRLFENQKWNLYGWQKHGFIEYVGGYSGEHFFTKLTYAIGKMSTYTERLKRSRKGRNTVDGKGIGRLCMILTE